MKLSGLNLHLTRQSKQNKFSMTDPPTTERDFASLVKLHSRIINKVSYFYATDNLQGSCKLGTHGLALVET